MKKTSLNKFLILGALLLGSVAQSWANDYYAKIAVAISSQSAGTGSGIVYVDEETNGTELTKSEYAYADNANVTFLLYAQPSTGYEFIGWATADNTSTTASSDNPWSVTINSSSTSGSTPTDGGTRYAVFKALPQFFFEATATKNIEAAGTVTASVGEPSKYGDHYNSTSASTTATFAVTNIARGYYWIGWNDSGTGTTTTEQTITSTITNNTANSTATLTKYAIFGQYADPESIAASNLTISKGEIVSISYTLSPTGCFEETSFFSDDEDVATVDADGKVQGVSAGTTTITITVNKIDSSATPITKVITVTVKEQCATPVVTFSNVTGTGADVTLTTATSEATIYYTVNGTTPTASSTAYSSSFHVNVGDVVRAIAIVPDNTLWSPSGVATKTYTAQKVTTPSIVIGGDGTISFSCSEEGTVTYKYCISDDGDCTPTTVWNGTPIAKNLANNEKIIKVIASKDGCIDSDPATKQYTASGISGTTVILNDYEDHTWTYYAGVPADVDGGNYNTNYAGKIYSPDPRNVKITYQANGGAVSIDEDEDEFVYYKTIEKINNAYKYQVISNPFSKRPTGKGFGGWKITGGAGFIKNKAADAILALDEEIEFENLPYSSVNCTSAEIELTATWVDATIVKNTTTGLSNTGTYETNIIVLSQNYSTGINPSYPCTIMMVEPDGSADYRSYTFSRGVTPPSGGIAKIEFATWSPNADISMAGRNLWIGRGVTCSGTTRSVTLAANNGTINQVAKIESGSFTSLTHYSSAPSGITKQILVLGNDYDRANNVNNKLTFSGHFEVDRCAVGGYVEACRVYSKSGSFMTGTAISSADRDHSYYMSRYSTNGPKVSRYIEIEGGEWYANINGGQDNDGTTVDNTHDLFVFRMRGGKVRGCVYGAAEQTNSSGNRVMVFTGGQVGGWICGASNGTSTSGGVLYGKTFVYFGGNAECNTKYQERTPAAIRNSLGGYVYASGCGSSATSHVGEVTQGTNIVMADNAKVQYGVYGGGAYGYSSGTANVYVTGGQVESSYDASYNVYCGVYGGARQNDAGPTNVYMTGGLIEGNTHNSIQGGGLFGGSNAQGDLTGSVKMVVTGGQVGTTSQTANIHGGGYGASTTVSQNVDVTLGTRNTSTGVTSGTAVVYGDVYGGSALGKVNGTAATNTYHTNVTLNAGTINGSLYGGALGNSTTAANVYGPVAVKVYGGSVLTTDGTGANGSGAVYGANNVYGAPQRAVTVDIYGTDEAPEEGEYALFAVYGGGNQAAYTYTETGKIYPQVTIHNCDNSIEYVYGGGNQAAVPGTQVKVYGGNVIGNVFGGGNNADVTTNGTAVDIYGGTILNVFGGNNNGGSVTGNITVTVNAQAEGSGTACTMAVGNVYGGGNIASYTGSPVVDFLNGTSTGSIFGGGKGKDAVVVGNPTVNIGDWDDDHSAYIGGSVFGGGDLAAVEGNPIVVIRDCGTTICGDLYGGGNAAPVYSTNTTMWGGTVKGNVFGGGNGSDATKNVKGAQVGYKRDDATAGTGDGDAVTNIYGGTIGTWTTVSGVETCTAGGGVFGGSNTNGNIRGAVQFTMDEQACTETGAEQCDLKVKEAYGAGNEAAYKGTGITFALGCITSQNEIYGGAKAADLKGDVNLRITNGHFDKVFGGNNISGKLEGKIVVTVDETGCKPVTIGALYGGGNQAAYSVYGYGTDGSVNTSGSDPYADPVVNIVSCTRIDTIFGGGLGSTAVMVGNPKITVQQVAGEYDPDDDDASDGYSTNTGKLGAIGTIFGGGNEAEVKGTPEIRIATEDAILRADGTTSLSRESANITGNIYGGGNKAKVTGNTKVVIGPQKATVTP